jgi:Arc/MetJ family transcription regulator
MRSPVVKRKNIAIDQEKLQQARRVLDARTETEAIDKALDQVLFGEQVLRAMMESAAKGKRVRDAYRNLR